MVIVKANDNLGTPERFRGQVADTRGQLWFPVNEGGRGYLGVHLGKS